LHAFEVKKYIPVFFSSSPKTLHLVGILFPHINDDARSKSHQINILHCCLFNDAIGSLNYIAFNGRTIRQKLIEMDVE